MNPLILYSFFTKSYSLLNILVPWGKKKVHPGAKGEKKNNFYLVPTFLWSSSSNSFNFFKCNLSYLAYGKLTAYTLYS